MHIEIVMWTRVLPRGDSIAGRDTHVERVLPREDIIAVRDSHVDNDSI